MASQEILAKLGSLVESHDSLRSEIMTRFATINYKFLALDNNLTALQRRTDAGFAAFNNKLAALQKRTDAGFDASYATLRNANAIRPWNKIHPVPVLHESGASRIRGPVFLHPKTVAEFWQLQEPQNLARLYHLVHSYEVVQDLKDIVQGIEWTARRKRADTSGSSEVEDEDEDVEEGKSQSSADSSDGAGSHDSQGQAPAPIDFSEQQLKSWLRDNTELALEMLAQKLGLNLDEIKLHMAMQQKGEADRIFGVLKRKRSSTDKPPPKKRRRGDSQPEEQKPANATEQQTPARREPPEEAHATTQRPPFPSIPPEGTEARAFFDQLVKPVNSHGEPSASPSSSLPRVVWDNDLRRNYQSLPQPSESKSNSTNQSSKAQDARNHPSSVLPRQAQHHASLANIASEESYQFIPPSRTPTEEYNKRRLEGINSPLEISRQTPSPTQLLSSRGKTPSQRSAQSRV